METPDKNEKRVQLERRVSGRREGAKQRTPSAEKRHETRKPMNSLAMARVEIPLPFPKGIKIVKEIIDSSATGLSFKMPQEEGLLLPGTVIKDIVIYDKDKTIKKLSAEVMYAKPLANSSDYKIGIRFTENSHKRFALGGQGGGITHAVRPIRHTLSNRKPHQKTVQFIDHDGLPCLGLLKNISHYGLAFEIEKGEKEYFLRISDTINPFVVVVDGTTIYDGKVTIAVVQTKHGKTRVGVSLDKPFEGIHDVVGQHETANRMAETSLFLKLAKVDTPFKAIVADLRYVLESVRDLMGEEEEKASHEGMVHRDKIEKAVLERFERFVFNDIDSAMQDINRLVQNFDEQTHLVHRDYFQKQLGALIQQSPFVSRCYGKPLGYAGDYEMMDMIYRNQYEGDTLFAKLVHTYFCRHIPPARAVQNRVPFLLKKIEQVSKKEPHKGKRNRILSLACGPANEAIEFIKNSEASNNVELALIDIEPEALYHTQEMILAETRRNKRHTKTHIYYLPLAQLIRVAEKHAHLNGQDLIYCVGLFDYLTDRLFQKTIRTLYRMLSPEGMLVVGNFDPCNPFKACLEYCAEWYLIHRSQAEMVRLAREVVGPVSEISCEAEPTGINNFLIVKR